MNCKRCGKNLALVGRAHNCQTTVALSNAVRPTAQPADTKFDKKAYQRDYMRKRRAEKKIHDD